jgi:DNA-directed RNA polymerase specialized sigma24 family protein
MVLKKVNRQHAAKIQSMVDDFLTQLRRDSFEIGLAGYPKQDANAKAIEPNEQEILEEVSSRAEREIGFTPEKIGWLAWFKNLVSQEKGLLQRFQKVALGWPPIERDLFELYFIGDMELETIALTLHEPLISIQRRLREEIIRQALYESKTSSFRIAKRENSRTPRN